MKILVIHPKDESTTFLEPIYENVDGKEIIQSQTTPKKVSKLIKTSGRVLMMGHGSPRGLFSMNLFDAYYRPFVIRSDESVMLKKQTENVYIFCHANEYVEANDLHGFYSGMFISEVREAILCGISNPTKAMVTESNQAFSRIVGKHINLPKNELYQKVIEEYGELAKINPVAAYNLSRLAVR